MFGWSKSTGFFGLSCHTQHGTGHTHKACGLGAKGRGEDVGERNKEQKKRLKKGRTEWEKERGRKTLDTGVEKKEEETITFNEERGIERGGRRVA